MIRARAAKEPSGYCYQIRPEHILVLALLDGFSKGYFDAGVYGQRRALQRFMDSFGLIRRRLQIMVIGFDALIENFGLLTAVTFAEIEGNLGKEILDALAWVFIQLLQQHAGIGAVVAVSIGGQLSGGSRIGNDAPGTPTLDEGEASIHPDTTGTTPSHGSLQLGYLATGIENGDGKPGAIVEPLEYFSIQGNGSPLHQFHIVFRGIHRQQVGLPLDLYAVSSVVDEGNLPIPRAVGEMSEGLEKMRLGEIVYRAIGLFTVGIEQGKAESG